MATVTNLYVIAAICGNFWQESTVNPGIWENLTVNSPGYGLGQWTDDLAGTVFRRTALFNWLDANNFPHDSGQGQLEFLIYENVWVPNGAGYPSAYNTLSDFLLSTSTNLSDLTYEFFHHWEGIDDGTGPTRLAFAQDAYANFLIDDGTRVPWTASNSYLSRSVALDNCMLIKDFFMGVTPPTPPTPPGPIPPYHRNRKGLPLWLIYDLSKGRR